MTTVLERICADKLVHIASAKSLVPPAEIRARAEAMPPTRGFIDALRRSPPALIAEVKKASPSKGIIRADFDAAGIARTYESAGAACLSVLTDIPYFQGDDRYLAEVRAAVSLPLLRKDFMLDPYQIHEARALGADCILLIMAALDDAQARDLYALATALSLDTLFEVHDAGELDRALALGPRMVGVNNRNLKTLDVDLETGRALAAVIPGDVVKVAESGIDGASIAGFAAAGYGAFLVGESLMREDDIAAATRRLLAASGWALDTKREQA